MVSLPAFSFSVYHSIVARHSSRRTGSGACVTPLSLKSKTPETECKKKDCAYPVRSDKAWAKPLGHLAWAYALVGPGVATPLLPSVADPGGVRGVQVYPPLGCI